MAVMMMAMTATAEAKWVSAAGLTHEGVVDLHREGAVALADEQRGAEVGKGPHEHHEHGRDDGGRAQRNDDGEEPLQTGAAHVLAGLQQGVVHVFQSAGNIQEHQRIQLQAQHQQNAAEAVDAGHLEAGEVLDDVGDEAVAPPAAGSRNRPR